LERGFAVKKYLHILIVLLVGLLCPAIVQAKPVESRIVVDNVDSRTTAFVEKDRIMVPVEMLRNYIYDNIMLDGPNNRLHVYLFLPRFRLETDKLDELIYSGGVDLNFPVKEIAGQYYINLYGLEKILGISIQEQQSGNVLQITTGENSFFSPAQLNTVRQKHTFNGKINLVWDHITGQSRDLAREAKISGLDVISPTWFAIVNEDGLVANKADIKYVQDAHTKNYKVWALINNSFDRDLTRKVLNNERARQNVIKQLVVYSSLYNLDGINIDFENIYDDDRDKLSQFVRELTTALKEQNLTVSIDITVPSNTPYWSACYDRQELGKIVDYVMVMTYDEHWRTSQISGSVASLGWVDKGIAATLKYIPKEKLLMGIPFYTREWEEITENGKVKVKSKTLSMEQAEKIVKENNVQPVWLSDKGQFYVQYEKKGARYRIWLEEEKSIRLKAELVHKYGLAGAAAWRKDFEKAQIWDVLNTTLKKQPANNSSGS